MRKFLFDDFRRFKDLIFSFCSVQCEWEKAAHYANILRQQCKWSPAAYTYQYATFTYMIMAEKNRPELRPEVDKYLK